MSKKKFNGQYCRILFNLSPHVMCDQPDEILGLTSPYVTCDMLKIFVKSG